MVELQKVEGHGVRGCGLGLDTLVAVSEVVPIDQSRAENGDQSQTDVDLIVCFGCLNGGVL